MGGGGHEMPKIPKYTHYKWENCPQIVNLQKRLAVHGLKDPWARNYAWKFMNPLTKGKTIPWYMMWQVNSPLPRGFTIGGVAVVLYIAFDQLSGQAAKRKAHGGH
ncbi:NADH dehydrogenase [ubiquinone] 1 beta subcomplex subunit 3-like [Ruditapes philippinarum]|uniref:NADH dehydrogenase [ubiquinone] 1 beta subcomplex subunit 3-like n=1 Tax=Ruditapes philippinarum TaxID=129788 RepID=UPI00295ACA02|nr:NADH dehydrogenase [ubiquinone] 1 beta subcomplex subunit 3-like [Ruditapes philippinarum]